ncbi:MAG: transposase [Paralcaligenes sp.]
MEEFKLEAVKQIARYQRPVAEVTKRLGVSTHSLYARVKWYGKAAQQPSGFPTSTIPS